MSELYQLRIDIILASHILDYKFEKYQFYHLVLKT
jgi:hypothetical protein